MRLIGSLVFLVGALSVGAYAYFPLNTPQQSRLLDIIQIEAQVPATATDATAAQDTARSFSPGASAFGTLVNALSTRSPDEIAHAPGDPDEAAVSKAAPTRTYTPSRTAEPRSSTAWRTIVTSGSTAERRAPAAQDDYMARYRLARSLQTELARVGCYGGNIDGDWGPGSKRAATAFLRKVNATLPVDTPDAILLTLIEGHVDKACGVECPSGQVLAFNGRCVPNVIVASGPERGTLLGRKTLAAKSASPKPSWSTGTQIVQAAPPVPAPRAQGLAETPAATAPMRVATPARERSGPTDTAWRRSAETVDTEAIEQAATSSAHVQPRKTPLPGLMALGVPPPSPSEIVPHAPLATATTAAAAVPPNPARAPVTRALPRQAKLAIDGNDLDAPHFDDTRQTWPAQQSNLSPYKARSHQANRERAAIARPAPVRATPPRKVRAVKADRHRKYRGGGTVRTSMGRVRRGSPQHNLMQSLGGVF